ncbi:MAG: hypothetical protein K2Y29_19395 [Beijerinckiaceae bacterium]|nr:hypothetical protein [Beijerinckiaceae bacterium]
MREAGAAIPLRLRGSAAAAALAAETGLRSAHEVVALFTQDIAIEDDAAFALDCARALEAARAGSIVCMGAPVHAATKGASYIRPGPRLGERLFSAGRFVHAGDLATAWACVQRKDVLNLGVYLFPPGLMRDEIEKRAPRTSIAVRLAAESAEYNCAGLQQDALARLPDECLTDLLPGSGRTVIATSSGAAPISMGGERASA